MVGASGHRHLEVRSAYDCAHDGEWRPRRLEDRALLDVQLDERVDVVARCRGDPGGIEAALAHSRPDLGVHRVDCSYDRREPQKFVAKREPSSSQIATTSSGRRGLPFSFDQRFDRRQSGNDAQGAVEPAAVAHRVDVRSR